MLHQTAHVEPDRCRSCTLQGAGLCHALARVAPPGTTATHLRRVARDTILAEQGTQPTLFGVLRKGYLRKEKLRDDGRRTLLGLVCPGDLLFRAPDQTLDYTLEAATDAEICACDPHAVRRAMDEDRQFRRQIILDATRQLQQQSELVWRRGLLTSRERIIAFVVTATEIMPVEHQPDGSLIVTIELGRRDWADLANTTVETISRTMSLLTERGLVSTIAPSRYRIHDVAALTRLAGLEPGPQGDMGKAPPRLSTCPAFPPDGLTGINAEPDARTRLRAVQSSTPQSRGASERSTEHAQEEIRR